VYACRECEQPINQATEVCPYCGADLIVLSAEDGTEKPRKKSLRKVLILWGIVFSSITAVAWFALPWRLAGSKSEAEAHAISAVTALQQALATYQTTEGTFPSSLEPLGAVGRAALQNAEAGRYTLQYTPGKLEGDGRVKTYALTARAGNYGYLNLFTDETGAIRTTREDRAAIPQDPSMHPDAFRR
jgi:hypothetical protein